jgi:hypothetical protein
VGNERGLSIGEENDAGGFNHRESFCPLPPWDCLARCTFVMYFQWDNYHLKLCNPVRIAEKIHAVRLIVAIDFRAKFVNCVIATKSKLIAS